VSLKKEFFFLKKIVLYLLHCWRHSKR